MQKHQQMDVGVVGIAVNK